MTDVDRVAPEKELREYEVIFSSVMRWSTHVYATSAAEAASLVRNSQGFEDAADIGEAGPIRVVSVRWERP